MVKVELVFSQLRPGPKFLSPRIPERTVQERSYSIVQALLALGMGSGGFCKPS